MRRSMLRSTHGAREAGEDWGKSTYGRQLNLFPHGPTPQNRPIGNAQAGGPLSARQTGKLLLVSDAYPFLTDRTSAPLVRSQNVWRTR